ncbi:MAG: hypothetical protein WBE26_10825 [Phycisphaerae bacterium]
MGNAGPTQRPLRRRLRALLSGRYLPVVLAILAILMALPSLWVGWVMDDHFHRMTMLGSSRFPEAFGSPMDLFRFFNGDPERTGRVMDIGLLPWWTFKEVKAGFWRPLTVLTHWVDYQLWPELPALMHAQSLLWFGGVVAAVAVLYRRLMGATWVAGLAALLYAIDDAHGMPVGFLANRNVLPASLFGVLALLAHDRWRRDGRRYGAVLGPVLFAVSLLFKEAGLATTAYLFAYALFLDRGTWKQRLTALLPYAAIVVAWRVAWDYQDYGVWGIGPYVDPIAEPLRYAVAVVHHAPLLLLGQWALPPPELSIILEPPAVQMLWVGAVIAVALLALVMIPLVRRDVMARFWAAGMILSLLPICATFPGDRLLFFTGIGAMGLLVQFLSLVFGPTDRRPVALVWRVPAMSFAVLFILVHGVAAPILLPLRAGYPIGTKKFLDQHYVQAPMDRSVEQQDVVIVNPPSPFHAIYLPILRELDNEPVPRHTRILAPGYSAMTVRRPDERTLVIRPERGYLAWVFDRLFRGENHPMLLGERVELTGMTVEVTALTVDGRPAEAAFRFAVPLEDPSLRWLYWKDGAFVAFTLPAVGQAIELPPAIPAL